MSNICAFDGLYIASRMITSRRRDNLHEIRERLNLQLASVVLGHPVRQLAARALNLTYFSIAMYEKEALGGAKINSGCKHTRVPCILLLKDLLCNMQHVCMYA